MRLPCPGGRCQGEKLVEKDKLQLSVESVRKIMIPFWDTYPAACGGWGSGLAPRFIPLISKKSRKGTF
jgi:hypothetical protein